MEPNSISLGFVHTIPSFVKNIHCTVSCTFDFMKNLSHIRLAFISNGTPNKAEKKGAPAQVSERKNRWKGTRCKKIKMKIIHLSRSARQLEPLFDNVMHTIMYAQCEGHREMLKNICCYVSSILYEKREEVARFTKPKQWFLVPVSLSRTSPLVHRILSAECLIQLASQ